MGVCLNGGTPISHPKMIIFSRKTDGFAGETQHFRSYPQIDTAVKVLWLSIFSSPLGCHYFQTCRSSFGRFCATEKTNKQRPPAGRNVWYVLYGNFWCICLDFHPKVPKCKQKKTIPLDPKKVPGFFSPQNMGFHITPKNE